LRQNKVEFRQKHAFFWKRQQKYEKTDFGPTSGPADYNIVFACKAKYGEVSVGENVPRRSASLFKK